ncbi:hypothetical protein MKW94_022958, partial [Papaver nudicaule]|nr:hypothetical protein [Papaver nudicaule]
PHYRSGDFGQVFVTDKETCIFTFFSLRQQREILISLSALVRWMGSKAEELGVEIYLGLAASE